METDNPVVAALREVIIAQQDQKHKHEPSPSEYLALLAATLRSDAETQESQLQEMLKLLCQVTPLASKVVVQTVYKQLSQTLLQIAKQCSRDQLKILRSTLQALGLLGRVQECTDAVWNSQQGLQSINAFLSFLDDENAKLHETAQNALFEILLAHKQKEYKAIRTYLYDFVIGVFKACTRSEYKRSLAIIQFLDKSLALLSDKHIISIMDMALRLQSCNQPILTAASYKMIDFLFQSPHCTIQLAEMERIIEYLLTHKPQSDDMEANSYYFTSLTSAVCMLNRTSHDTALNIIPILIEAALRGFETDFTQIHCASSTSIKRILITCYSQADMNAAIGGDKSCSFSQTIAILEQLLHLRYQHSWIYSLDCVRSIFNMLSKNGNHAVASKLLSRTADVFHACELGSLALPGAIKSAVQDTLGVALVHFGPVYFLENVPLRGPEDPAFIGVNDTREWVLLILRKNLKRTPCDLADFGNTLLGAARQCSVAVKKPDSVGLTNSDEDIRKLQLIRTRVIQFWSFFPEFCHLGPTDIAKTMPRMTTILEQCVSDTTYPEIVLDVINGVTHLVQIVKQRFQITSVAKSSSTSAAAPDVKALQDTVHVFIPHLLKCLEEVDITDHRFQSYIHSVSEMCSIAPLSLVGSVAKKLLQMILSTTTVTEESEKKASAWMSILLSIVPHLPEAVVQVFYRTIEPFLSVGSSLSLQKRSYQVLDTLVSTHAALIFSYKPRSELLSLAAQTLRSCHISARSMRLRCLESIVRTIEDYNEFVPAMQMVLGEVLVCLKDANKKTRDGAADLLRLLIQRSKADDLFSRLVAGIAQDNTSMRSASLLSLSLLLVEAARNNTNNVNATVISQVAEIVEPVCYLATDPATGGPAAPEQVRGVLTLLRVCSVYLPRDTLKAVLPVVLTTITTRLGDEKAKYTTECRAILRKVVRRLDADEVRAMLPESERTLLTHVLRMARRVQRKKEQTARKDRLDELLDSESEGEGDDDGEEGADGNGGKGDSNKITRPKATRVQDLLKDLEKPQPAAAASMEIDNLLDDEAEAVINAAIAANNGRLPTAPRLEDEVEDDKDEEDEYQIVMDEEGKMTIKFAREKRPGKRSRDEEEEEEQEAAAAREAKRLLPPAKRRAPGEEYRSKKAGGDVWKRGMLEPHAYIPLDPKLLVGKKSRPRALEVMSSVVQKHAGPKGKKAMFSRKKRESLRAHKAEKL